MNTHFIKKYIFAVLFIVVLFTYSAFNLINEFPLLKQNISEFSLANAAEIRASVAKLEATINENVYEKYSFIEGYGLVQRIFGTNVENGFSYVKDEDGALTAAEEEFDSNLLVSNVDKIKEIGDLAVKYGAQPIIFFGADYYNEGQNVYERGIPYADYGDSLDYLKKSISASNIPIFDYREFRNEIYKAEDEPMIYNTDHHWRTNTCFDLYSNFVDYMAENYQINLNGNQYDLTDKSNYNFILYKDFFLGSQGRETGVTYAGLDDFVLVFPKFETDYSYAFKGAASSDEVILNGSIDKTILRIDNLKSGSDIYSTDRYSTYLGSVNYCDKITNNLNPKAPRILVIRDSYFAPIASLLANSCSELDLVWSIKYEGSYEELIKNGDYDYVIVEGGTANLIGNMFYEKN